jgi:hypothetical protein
MEVVGRDMAGKAESVKCSGSIGNVLIVPGHAARPGKAEIGGTLSITKECGIDLKQPAILRIGKSRHNSPQLEPQRL